MSWDLAFGFAQQYGLPIAMAVGLVWLLITETLVPGKVRDREIELWRAFRDEEKKRADNWEATALRLSTIVGESADAVKEMKDTILRYLEGR